MLCTEQVVSVKFTFLNGLYSVLQTRVEELLAIGGPSLQKTVHSGPVSTTVKIRGLNPQAILETKRLLDRTIKGERFVETLGGVRCVPVRSPFFVYRYFDTYAVEITHFSLTFVFRDSCHLELRLYGNRIVLRVSFTTPHAPFSSSTVLPLPSSSRLLLQLWRREEVKAVAVAPILNVWFMEASVYPWMRVSDCGFQVAVTRTGRTVSKVGQDKVTSLQGKKPSVFCLFCGWHWTST